MSSVQIERSGYQSSTRLSPASIAGVVVVHLGLGAAILNMTAIQQVLQDPTFIPFKHIPADPPPPPATEPDQPQSKVKPRVTTTKPVVDDLPTLPDTDFAKTEIFPPFSGTGGSGVFVDPPKPFDPPPPVLVDAKPDARFMRDFQPPYPAAMLRLQTEGNVVVRVLIGADGRVQDITMVSAVDPAFFEATRRQALSRWRFTPATRDGVPVASERTMTVRFRLTD